MKIQENTLDQRPFCLVQLVQNSGVIFSSDIETAAELLLSESSSSPCHLWVAVATRIRRNLWPESGKLEKDDREHCEWGQLPSALHCEATAVISP